MEKIRTFVAVPVSDEVRVRVAEVEDKLRGVGADVKWVAPENIHLTVKFLGNVEVSVIEDLSAGLRAALTGLSCFGAILAGMGTFPEGRRYPRVVWMGITEGNDRLRDLASKVDHACSALGFEMEERPFRPHLTIGRVRRGSGALVELADEVGALEFNPLKLDVDRVNLMRSKLSPKGPTYTVLESFNLERA